MAKNVAAPIPTEKEVSGDEEVGTDPADFDVVTQEPLHWLAYAQQFEEPQPTAVMDDVVALEEPVAVGAEAASAVVVGPSSAPPAGTAGSTDDVKMVQEPAVVVPVTVAAKENADRIVECRDSAFHSAHLAEYNYRGKIRKCLLCDWYNSC